MTALKLPKQSEEEKTERKAALQVASRRATEVPLQAAQQIAEALRLGTVREIKSCVFNAMREIGVIELLDMYQ